MEPIKIPLVHSDLVGIDFGLIPGIVANALLLAFFFSTIFTVDGNTGGIFQCSDVGVECGGQIAAFAISLVALLLGMAVLGVQVMAWQSAEGKLSAARWRKMALARMLLLPLYLACFVWFVPITYSGWWGAEVTIEIPGRVFSARSHTRRVEGGSPLWVTPRTVSWCA